MATVNHPIAEEWLSSLLTRLGQTADEVAATLREEEITGVRQSPGRCPVAQYVLTHVRRFVPAAEVAISVCSNACISIKRPAADYEWVTASMPEAAREFIRAFDRGAYEALVAESVTEETDPAES